MEYLKKNENRAIIIVPKSVKWEHVRNFINEIANLDHNIYEYITIDVRNIEWVEPLATITLVAFLEERIIKECLSLKKLCYLADPVNPYAAHIGFYKALRIPEGKAIGAAYGSLQYLPITKIETSKLQREACENNKPIVEYLEKEAYRIGAILSSKIKMNDNSNSMGYIIFEMLRNIIEHSDSECIWYSAQVWPKKNQLEIAIVDTGIGIKKSIESNVSYGVHRSNIDAIKFALEPGVSKSYKPRRRTNPFSDNYDDPYANSGFGLYVMHNLCKELGSFKIISTGNCIEYQKDRIKFTLCSFGGTAIGMRFQLSELEKIPELKLNIIKTGEEIIKNKTNVIKMASAASKAQGPISKI